MYKYLYWGFILEVLLWHLYGHQKTSQLMRPNAETEENILSAKVQNS